MEAFITAIDTDSKSSRKKVTETMASMRQIIDAHEKTMLQHISTIEMKQKKLMEGYKTPLKNELKSLSMKNAKLKILLSSQDHTKLLQVKQEFDAYVNKTNETLQTLEMPTRTYYHLQGLDQLQELKEKILQCEQYVKYINPRLEKKIADNKRNQTLSLEENGLTDFDMKIVADTLRNNAVRKMYFFFYLQEKSRN
jgi:hypothetical protein